MKRFLHVVKHEAALHARTALVTGFGIAGLTLAIAMLRWLQRVQPIDVLSFYRSVAPLWAAIITTTVFSELRDDGHAIEFLLRPAAPWQKVTAKLLVSLLGCWLVGAAAFGVASAVAGGLYLALAHNPFPGIAVGAATGEYLRSVAGVLWESAPLHAVAFFGAVYFRGRGSAGKTMLSFVVWGLTSMVIIAVAARLIFAPYMAYADRPGVLQDALRELSAALPLWMRSERFLLEVVRWPVTLILWALSYLRLRETEA